MKMKSTGFEHCHWLYSTRTRTRTRTVGIAINL